MPEQLSPQQKSLADINARMEQSRSVDPVVSLVPIAESIEGQTSSPVESLGWEAMLRDTEREIDAAPVEDVLHTRVAPTPISVILSHTIPNTDWADSLYKDRIEIDAEPPAPVENVQPVESRATLDQIEAIRERDAITCGPRHHKSETGSSPGCYGAMGMAGCPVCDADSQAIDDRRTLLASLDAMAAARNAQDELCEAVAEKILHGIMCSDSTRNRLKSDIASALIAACLGTLSEEPSP